MLTYEVPELLRRPSVAPEDRTEISFAEWLTDPAHALLVGIGVALAVYGFWWTATKPIREYEYEMAESERSLASGERCD